MIDPFEFSICWQKLAEDLTQLLRNEGITYIDIIYEIGFYASEFKRFIKEKKESEKK